MSIEGAIVEARKEEERRGKGRGGEDFKYGRDRVIHTIHESYQYQTTALLRCSPLCLKDLLRLVA